MEVIEFKESIRINKIYKTYPVEIKNDVPKVLQEYYNTDFLYSFLNNGIYRNTISFGGMFMNMKEKGMFLTECECLITGKKWFGEIPYNEANGELRLSKPKYKFINNSTKQSKNNIILIEGERANDILNKFDRNDLIVVNFEFHGDNLKDNLNEHLKKLKKLVSDNVGKTFIITNWYLEKILTLCFKDEINNLFNSEKDLIYFLFNFETKINEIALFKKIILCDYYKENYMFFAARAGQKEVEEETDRIRNVHSYMFTNNFYINYCNSSLPNTYRFETSIINLENDYDKIIDDVLFEGRYINRYKPVIGDEDEDYFGENFMKILDYEVVSVFS